MNIVCKVSYISYMKETASISKYIQQSMVGTEVRFQVRVANLYHWTSKMHILAYSTLVNI